MIDEKQNATTVVIDSLSEMSEYKITPADGPRTTANIRGELNALKAEAERIAGRIAALRVELTQAAIKEAEVQGHPWLGKAVRSPATMFANARHGIVKLHTTAVVNKFRRGYRPQRGEFYVESLSGKTAYSLKQGKWELVK